MLWKYPLFGERRKFLKTNSVREMLCGMCGTIASLNTDAPLRHLTIFGWVGKARVSVVRAISDPLEHLVNQVDKNVFRVARQKY